MTSDIDGLVPTHPSQTEVVDALEASWTALATFAADFSEEQWEAETPLPGWRVRDVFAHIVGTELTLAGADIPEVDIGSPAHVHNDIGRANEAWVQSMADLDSAELLNRFRDTTTGRVASLRAMSAEEWAAPSWTPAGQSTYGRWMHIRVYDCWSHEQDVRVALRLPGGLNGPAAELSLVEVAIALGYIVGKRGEAADGSRIELRLQSGKSIRILRVGVLDGRATVVAAFADDAPPTTVLTLPFELFMRLTAGRRNATNALSDGLIQLDGDLRAGEKIARNLAFTV